MTEVVLIQYRGYKIVDTHYGFYVIEQHVVLSKSYGVGKEQQ